MRSPRVLRLLLDTDVMDFGGGGGGSGGVSAPSPMDSPPSPGLPVTQPMPRMGPRFTVPTFTPPMETVTDNAGGFGLYTGTLAIDWFGAGGANNPTTPPPPTPIPGSVPIAQPAPVTPVATGVNTVGTENNPLVMQLLDVYRDAFATGIPAQTGGGGGTFASSVPFSGDMSTVDGGTATDAASGPSPWVGRGIFLLLIAVAGFFGYKWYKKHHAARSA